MGSPLHHHFETCFIHIVISIEKKYVFFRFRYTLSLYNHIANVRYNRMPYNFNLHFLSYSLLLWVSRSSVCQLKLNRLSIYFFPFETTFYHTHQVDSFIIDVCDYSTTILTQYGMHIINTVQLSYRQREYIESVQCH